MKNIFLDAFNFLGRIGNFGVVDTRYVVPNSKRTLRIRTSLDTLKTQIKIVSRTSKVTLVNI